MFNVNKISHVDIIDSDGSVRTTGKISNKNYIDNDIYELSDSHIVIGGILIQVNLIPTNAIITKIAIRYCREVSWLYH